MGIHDEHRKRLRERFLKEGLDNFNEINALEILLFYSIPRKDTNTLAHALLDMFGSFAKVLEAPPEALMRVKGISTETATYLNLVGQTCRFYYVNQVKAGDVFDTIDSCIDYLQPRVLSRTKEIVQMMSLESRCKFLKHVVLGEGTSTSTNISTRKIAEIALNAEATSIVLAHNHPNGFAIPSKEDIDTTLQLKGTLERIGVKLVDHLVMAGTDCVSMLQSGIFDIKSR